MKTTSVLAMSALALAASGCATQAPVAGLNTATYTTFACEGGKSFGARMDQDLRSVRLRTHEGSVNVVAGGDGNFAGDGWTFATQGADGISLRHQGKVIGKNCRKEG